MFFSGIEPAPADPILGLTEAFRKDPRPLKVNLGVGVFVDEKGTTPVLECVKRAERLLWETEKSKGYMPISGPAEFGDAVANLVFGADFHEGVIGIVAIDARGENLFSDVARQSEARLSALIAKPMGRT